MFGISKTLKIILGKLNDLVQQLTITRGSVYEIEGIVKKIFSLLKNTFDKLFEVSENVKKILEIVSSEVEEDKSDFFFSQFKIDNHIIKGRLESVSMNEFQKVTGTFQALKQNGQPAKVQNPRVEVDHPEMATATISGENEVTVEAIEGAIPEPTALLVTVFADADLGEGVRELSVVGTIPLTPGEAESLAITFGEPTDKTPSTE